MLYAYWNLIQISNETGQTGQVRDGYALLLFDIPRAMSRYNPLT